MFKSSKASAAAMAASMIIFGTIGIFRRGIELPSEVLAFSRGVMGSLFLLLFLKITGRGFDMAAVKKRLLLLILTGAMIGLNWILLFEAYNYTSVAVATLAYYMQPVIVILASPLVFRERITLRKGICVAAAVTGMVLVSGIVSGAGGAVGLHGVVLGLGAAALYAGVVILNKKATGVPIYEKTIIQLASAAGAMIPYMLATGTLHSYSLNMTQGLSLATVGIVHTGIAYAMYFGALEVLPAQTSAIMSYIDPVTAVLLSAVLLNEPMTPAGAAGAVMIIGAAIASEREGQTS